MRLNIYMIKKDTKIIFNVSEIFENQKASAATYPKPKTPPPFCLSFNDV